MKNYKLLCLIILALFIYSQNTKALSSNVSKSILNRYNVSAVAIGDTLPPLPLDAKIKFYIFDKPVNYKKIGIAQVICYSKFSDKIDVVVNHAKVKARELGGNCIILHGDNYIKEFDEGSSESPSTLETYIKYVFIVGIE